MMLSPWFVTGLLDAESSFSRSITRNNKSKLGWTLSLRFNLTMHIRESRLLHQVKRFFGGIGVIEVSLFIMTLTLLEI